MLYSLRLRISASIVIASSDLSERSNLIILCKLKDCFAPLRSDRYDLTMKNQTLTSISVQIPFQPNCQLDNLLLGKKSPRVLVCES